VKQELLDDGGVGGAVLVVGVVSSLFNFHFFWHQRILQWWRGKFVLIVVVILVCWYLYFLRGAAGPLNGLGAMWCRIRRMENLAVLSEWYCELACFGVLMGLRGYGADGDPALLGFSPPGLSTTQRICITSKFRFLNFFYFFFPLLPLGEFFSCFFFFIFIPSSLPFLFFSFIPPFFPFALFTRCVCLIGRKGRF